MFSAFQGFIFFFVSFLFLSWDNFVFIFLVFNSFIHSFIHSFIVTDYLEFRLHFKSLQTFAIYKQTCDFHGVFHSFIAASHDWVARWYLGPNSYVALLLTPFLSMVCIVYECRQICYTVTQRSVNTVTRIWKQSFTVSPFTVILAVVERSWLRHRQMSKVKWSASVHHRTRKSYF